MIGNSLVDYINIRLSITALRLVAPTSIGYLIISFFRPEYFVIPFGVVAVPEALFYLLVYLPRRRRLQAPPIYTPPPLTREERRRIFIKCVVAESTSNGATTPYPTGWFLPNNTIPKRGDAIDWLLWALFPPTTQNGSLIEEHKEEIDGYIEEIEKLLGTPLEQGTDRGVRSMRTTLDPVNMLHRPLIWYSIVAIVDTYTSLYLTFLGFKHYSPRQWNWRHSFPPRPILSLLSRSAPEGVVTPYWYRPHRSSTKLPLVFLHGIGIGLFPYIPFIQSVVNAKQDPDIGILLPELLPISMHMTFQAVAPRSQMLASLNIILQDLYSTDGTGWNRVVLAAHSYGTFIAGWIVRDCVASSESTGDDSLIDKIAHLVLVDPIPILISNHSVAHNFLYREPWTTTASSSSSTSLRCCYPSYSAASAWQLWYFASRDADIARTLCRSFFWSEGGMWREEVAAFLRRRGRDKFSTTDHVESMATYHDEVDDYVSPPNTQTTVTQRHQRRNMAVILGGSDQIIPAEAIRRYLTNEDMWKTRWVGKVADIDDSDNLNGLAGGDEEDGEEDGNQLEVLYDPKLDHAKIFDNRKDMIPLLEVVRRYVRDVQG